MNRRLEAEVRDRDDFCVFAANPWTVLGILHITRIDAGGRRVAIEAHIFAEDLRGTAEGHVPWDLIKEPNTMTNATVAQVEEVGDQRELKVTYKQGEGEQATEGSQTIYVPDDLSVVKMEKAPGRAVLAPGKDAFLVVRDEADGSRSVLRFARNGRTNCPPQYFIDGVQATGYNIDDMPVGDVEGIEIYAGPSGLPPEFNKFHSTVSCGAVIIWTRLPGG